MMVRAAPPARRLATLGLAIVGACLLAAYAWLAHRLTVDDDRSELGYLFAIVSIWAMVALAAWGGTRRWLAIGCASAAALAAWVARRWVDWDPRWIYLVQHAGIHLALGCVFGRTLLGTRTAFVTRLAALVHERVSPRLAAYTRGVTAAWTAYFFAMALASFTLFLYAPANWWSVLANFLTLPATVAMFAGEFALRRRVLPPEDRSGLWESIEAYRRRS